MGKSNFLNIYFAKVDINSYYYILKRKFVTNNADLHTLINYSFLESCKVLTNKEMRKLLAIPLVSIHVITC